MNDRDLEEIINALLGQLLALQARCDALETLVQILAVKQGSRRENVQAVMEKVRATYLQKRLARIEDRDPATAAQIDWRSDLSTVDDKLLDQLRFPDDPKPAG